MPIGQAMVDVTTLFLGKVIGKIHCFDSLVFCSLVRSDGPRTPDKALSIVIE